MRANLFRRKPRTILTGLSVATALFLLATLRSVLTTLASAVEVGSESRMVTRNAISIVFFVPQAYYQKLKAIPGVRKVSWANWFGAVYRDPRNFFPQFAIQADYFDLYPEILVPEDQKKAFMAERTAAIAGRRLMERFGWSLGQNVTLRGTIYPGDWTFTIRGVYTATNPGFQQDAMLFHYEALSERFPGFVEPNWYVLALEDPSLAASVAKRIDNDFRNSPSPTRTETERAFQTSFVTMYGNVGFLLNAIGMAVFFAILLVAANTMMMAARERLHEVAVLKTLGFSDRLLLGLTLAEALVITVGGGLLGVAGAKLLFDGAEFQALGLLPGFHVRWSTVALGLAVAVLLGVVSSLVPAWQTARLPVAPTLRRVA
ncbi:MAG: ABC transporter permease [Gemmatimonadetes bacterium]|nr:ABC transporter permease [Gemmatimonadota bacterium]